MSLRDSSNWLSAEMMAPVLSFALALTRAMYLDKEPSWIRRIIEAVMCGLISLSAGYATDAMGWPGEWDYAAAGAIGFLGADYIRTLAHRILNKEISKR